MPRRAPLPRVGQLSSARAPRRCAGQEIEHPVVPKAVMGDRIRVGEHLLQPKPFEIDEREGLQRPIYEPLRDAQRVPDVVWGSGMADEPPVSGSRPR